MAAVATGVRRSRDRGEYIESYLGEILVACPRCGQCARHVRLDPTDRSACAPRRLACSSCGFTKEWRGKRLQVAKLGGAESDGYFGLALWLQASVCGQTLWAYNYRQLGAIERMVRATLRERRPGANGWSNQSLISRLPRWVKSARNRKVILQEIERLRGSVGGRRTRR